jgi:methyl-accepting chemotaxis protein
MNLILKFNAVLLGTMAIGLVGTATIAHNMLHDKARAETLQNASVMMEAALATRAYTSRHIKPLLDNQMRYAFLPESVPSFAATEVFNALRNSKAEYNYKEAALNPTNPRDRTTDWEADVVNRFRNEAATQEIVGERDTPNGRYLYLARPIKITNASCLQCHSTFDAAPKPMLEKYGTANGFGWQMNETVGAQIVSVPGRFHSERAQATFNAFMASIAAVFAAVFVVLNLMLTRFVIRPVTKLAAVAEQASLGAADDATFDVRGNDEIAALARAFTRMRTSLKKAMTMIED